MKYNDPFEMEYLNFEVGYSRDAGPAVIYYHVDSGFAGDPNECFRLFYIDHHDFNRANP